MSGINTILAYSVPDYYELHDQKKKTLGENGLYIQKTTNYTHTHTFLGNHNIS